MSLGNNENIDKIIILTKSQDFQRHIYVVLLLCLVRSVRMRSDCWYWWNWSLFKLSFHMYGNQ